MPQSPDTVQILTSVLIMKGLTVHPILEGSIVDEVLTACPCLCNCGGVSVVAWLEADNSGLTWCSSISVIKA